LSSTFSKANNKTERFAPGFCREVSNTHVDFEKICGNSFSVVKAKFGKESVLVVATQAKKIVNVFDEVIAFFLFVLDQGINLDLLVPSGFLV